MKKLKYIFSIIQRRATTIFLLSIMFSSLLLIFMVGLSVKDVFYDYLRSDYGNIPDMKVKLNDLNKEKLLLIKDEIESIDSSIDVLYGYEDIYELSITDGEDSILANKMPILIKGMSLDKKLQVEIDSKIHSLEIANFEYVESFLLELKLDGLQIDDADSIRVISKSKSIEFGFCKEIEIQKDILRIESKFCEDSVDSLFKTIDQAQTKSIKAVVDSKKDELKILESDALYRTLVLAYNSKREPKSLELSLKDLVIANSMISEIELFENELIVTFDRADNMELNYKRYISHILKNFINYNRFVLKVKNYSFEEDSKDEESEEIQNISEELMFLNELTDILDIINFTNGNSAISSDYLASDLNNFGLLDNFTISSKYGEFNANIRSTIYYNPEKLYNSNILIFNNKVMQEQFKVGDKNNYVDIYIETSKTSKLKDIKRVILKYDKKASFVMQEDIAPSIIPKKRAFDIVVAVFSIFIFAILFVSMYVVLIQFYSNFESELALLKLFGSNQPYQAYINLMSFFISSILIYVLLQKEEMLISEVMQKYFFTSYDFDMNNYLISLGVLFLYVVIIYLIELVNIKKLNLIKGQ